MSAAQFPVMKHLAEFDFDAELREARAGRLGDQLCRVDLVIIVETGNESWRIRNRD